MKLDWLHGSHWKLTKWFFWVIFPLKLSSDTVIENNVQWERSRGARREIFSIEAKLTKSIRVCFWNKNARFSSPGQRLYELFSLFGIRPSYVVNLNLLDWNHGTKLYQTWLGWAFGDPLIKLCPDRQDYCCY